MRRPLGILSGAIDKLLVTPAADGKGFDIEIIDFKTNRLRPRTRASTTSLGPRASRPQSAEGTINFDTEAKMRARRPRSQHALEQIPFDFSAGATEPEDVVPNELSVDDQVRVAAADYQLQMQAYALAVAELMPSLMNEGSAIISTLHFLEPNREFHFAGDLLSHRACTSAIDSAMMEIISASEPEYFPVRPATHCRMCNFLGICPAGSDWLRSMRQT